MNHDNGRSSDNAQPTPDGEAATLWETAMTARDDHNLPDTEKALLEILSGHAPSTRDTRIADQALKLLYELYRERGAYEALAECCRAFLQKRPNHVDALCNLGDAYRMQGENDPAFQSYLRALELAPNHAAAHLNVGILFGRREQFQLAAHHFKQASALNPDDPAAYINLCKLAFVHNDYIQHGISALKRAIQLAP